MAMSAEEMLAEVYRPYAEYQLAQGVPAQLREIRGSESAPTPSTRTQTHGCIPWQSVPATR